MGSPDAYGEAADARGLAVLEQIAQRRLREMCAQISENSRDLLYPLR